MSSLIPHIEAASTPDRIASAAVGLFIERGFQATSVDDIVAAADLTKPTFYYHFQSKLELLHTLLDASLTRIESALREADDRHLPPGDRLRRLLKAYALEVCDRPQLWTIYFSERKVIDSQVMDTWREREREMITVLERTIVEGIDSEDFTPGDAFVLAMGAMGSVGWLHHWFRGDGRLSDEVIADQIASMACDGIVKALDRTISSTAARANRNRRKDLR